jgi:deoxyribodipyrimidine photo-lyase
LWSQFDAEKMRLYSELRDLPACRGTSRLSPHLHWGEISPRQLWHQGRGMRGSEAFLRQLVWREFAHHLLHHFPHTAEEPLRPQFASFPWDGDPDLLVAWQKGQTGYPLVDAGMRELWHTGWMHNRVRMVSASFLVKHLLLPWQLGAAWFWDTLVDASLANNTFGWQWTAGCGADAAPYFRIFNPMTQGKKFDPEGEYIRRWVPELARLPDKLIHEPWLGTRAVLEHLGVKLGTTYPHPVVDHALARQRALDSYRRMQAG